MIRLWKYETRSVLLLTRGKGLEGLAQASSEAERRNEGSTKCVRNPEKREFAMQTRDEKMLCISRFFCEAKSHLNNKKFKIRHLYYYIKSGKH